MSSECPNRFFFVTNRRTKRALIGSGLLWWGETPGEPPREQSARTGSRGRLPHPPPHMKVAHYPLILHLLKRFDSEGVQALLQDFRGEIAEHEAAGASRAFA